MRPGDYNLRHLKALALMVDTGSLSAAARLVNLTQPAITQGLAKLEQNAGLPLFERGPTGMTPTEAGAVLARRATAALSFIASQRVTAAQMRAFLALANHGSYAAAAMATGLREASLHRAVADLSLSVGQDLVERRGRGVTLTRRGQLLARRFKLAQVELRSAAAELSSLTGREVDQITVGAMPLCRARLLPTAIAEFKRAHNNVEIVVLEGSYSDLVGPLRDGEVDLMLGAMREEGQGDDLLQQPLFEDRPVVLGRAGHPLTEAGRPPSLQQLADFEWVLPGEGAPLRREWRRLFDEAGVRPPKVAIESGSVMLIRQLLVEGEYLTLLSPDQVAVELEAGWLVQIAGKFDRAKRTIALTTRASWRPTRLQAAFLSSIKASANALNRSRN